MLNKLPKKYINKKTYKALKGLIRPLLEEGKREGL